MLLEPGQRSGEQDVHVAAAGRKHVGEDLTAAAGQVLGGGGLSADLGYSATFITVLDKTFRWVNMTHPQVGG